MPDNQESNNRIDPFRAYNFKLDIQGVTEGHFARITGPDIDVQAIQYRQGGKNQVVHHLPGIVSNGTIQLSYGVTTSNELWKWFMTAVNGEVVRKNVSIIMLDSAGTQPVKQWDLIDAWPSQWRGASLDAMSNEVAIETISLVFESLACE